MMQQDQPQMQHNRIVKRRRAAPVERENKLKHARQFETHSRVPAVGSETSIPFSHTEVTIPHTLESSTTVTTTTIHTSSSSNTSLATSIITEPTTSSISTKETATSTPQPTSSDSSPTSSPPSTSVSSSSTPVPASGATSSSVSSGAIAGIVIAVLIAVLGVGLLLCFYRRRRGKQNKSPRWLQDMGGKFRPAQDIYQRTDSPTMREPRQAMPQLGPILIQPPVSYGNDSPMHTTYAPVSTSADKAATAIVKLTFVPTLPDELSIMHGERLQFLHDYDDGWALCVNSGGSQGMVPMECLQFSGENQGLESPRAITTERRASSLGGGGRY